MSRRKPAPEYYITVPPSGPRKLVRSDRYVKSCDGVIESRHATYEDALNTRKKNYAFRQSVRIQERKLDRVRRRQAKLLEALQEMEAKVAPAFKEFAKREGLI